MKQLVTVILFCTMFVALLSITAPDFDDPIPSANRSTGPAHDHLNSAPTPFQVITTLTPTLPSGGGSLQLDGGEAYVEIPYADELNILDTITIEAWVKRTNSRCETVVGNGWLQSYWLGFCNQAIRFYHGATQSVDGVMPIPLNEWTHVAITYDGTTRRYYVNGQLDQETDENAGPLAPADGLPLYVGADRDGGYYFQGLIDELRIWKVVRSQAQIKQTLHQVINAPQFGLLAVWSFDGSADDSVGGHHGALRGGAAFSAEGFPQGSAPANVAVPRWLEAPVLDGACDDPSYVQAETIELSGQAVTAAKLFHSGLDLYLCAEGLLVANSQHLAIRVDSDRSQSQHVGPGDYEFTISITGAVSVAQGNTEGVFEPLFVSEGDFSAAVAHSGDGTWDTEARFSLEWLGGYAHVDGLSLALETGDGALLQGWPISAQALSPMTWGELTLTPLYTDTLDAASLFLDGRGGYLVVPYASELNPDEITIEAWVRAIDGDCGTLVGNGQSISYWLGLCDVLQFGHGGETSAFPGQHPLGEGWHHVAVTMDEAGMRTFYIDGLVDVRPGWEPPHEEPEGEEKAKASLGHSDRTLRVGSDRDVLADLNSFHGYLRQLRIWNRACTVQEIQETAFESLNGNEPGLVALWPFTDGLQDIAGGHHAGLVGDAALARETSDVTDFPSLPIAPPYTYPPPDPIPAWNGIIPIVSNTVTLDGICSLGEYPEAAGVVLEPDRAIQIDLMLTEEALYLCTNILFGQPDTLNATTLWVNRDGQGGQEPGLADLRIHLQPDAQPVIGTGYGGGYDGPPPEGIESAALRGDRFTFQEDIIPLDAPWWASEVRIPLTALAPFEPGLPLRLALFYTGTVPAGALPDLSEDRHLSGSWPKEFDKLQPNTWGAVTTSALPQAVTEMLSLFEDDAFPSNVPLLGPAHELSDAWPRMPPTASEFYAQCPGSVDDPAWDNLSPTNQAWLLGKYASYAFSQHRKWPMVDPSGASVAQAEGILNDIHVSPFDSPFIHDSHDLDMKLSVRYGDRWQSLFSEEDAAGERCLSTASGGPNLVLETESGGVPPHNASDVNARPSAGDHVTVKGRWIFDCGHCPKTEIHPIYFFESDRLEVRPLWPGGELKTTRVARVWMNSHPGAFSREFTGPLATFEFDVQFPDVGWMPFIRVVEGAPGAVAWEIDGRTAHITITPPGRSGQFYFELMLGYLYRPHTSTSRASDLFTLTWDEIEIQDDHDQGIIPDCDFVGPIPRDDCGEWFFAANVNGIWRQIFWNQLVNEEYDDVDHPNPVPLAHIPPVALADRDLWLQATAYDDDGILHEGGEKVISGIWPLGRLERQLGPRALAPPGGDWVLRYTVTAGSDVPSILVDEAFWAPRLVGEPGTLNLGELTVPGSGAPPLATSHSAFITEQPLQYGELTLLDSDEDRYAFILDDFANLTFGRLPDNVLLEVNPRNRWYYHLPEDVQEVVGYTGATLNVTSVDGQRGDQPYTLTISRTYRELPPDWGEPLDTPGGGRLVDLATPDPLTDVILPTAWSAEMRRLAMPWAWQHVAGDVDYYDILLPPTPPGCEILGNGRMEIYAPGTRLRIPALSVDTDTHIVLDDLVGLYPAGGHIYLEVASLARRDVYRLTATWTGTADIEPERCRRLEDIHDANSEFLGVPVDRLLTVGPDLSAWSFGQLELVPHCPSPVAAAQPVPGDPRCWAMAATTTYLDQSTVLDIAFASPADKPVTARLYDLNGVLLGESSSLIENISAPLEQTRLNGSPVHSHHSGQWSTGSTTSADGLLTQSHLKVERLAADSFYLLQIVPTFEINPDDLEAVLVAVSSWEEHLVYLPLILRE